MDHVFSSHAALDPHRRGSALGRLLSLWEVSRERQRLEALDDHLLRDIGLSREEATREARKPFWDAPDHWRR